MYVFSSFVGISNNVDLDERELKERKKMENNEEYLSAFVLVFPCLFSEIDC